MRAAEAVSLVTAERWVRLAVEDPLMGTWLVAHGDEARLRRTSDGRWLVHLYADVAVESATAEDRCRMDRRCLVALIAPRLTIEDPRAGTKLTPEEFAARNGGNPNDVRITKRRYPGREGFVIRA